MCMVGCLYLIILMLIPGQEVIKLKIARNLKDNGLQVQPGGVDFTVKKIGSWRNAGLVDFDNTNRTIPEFSEIPHSNFMYLKPGSYMVEFNETVDLPADVSAFVLPRSSVLRSGAVVQAGLLDPGYSGAVGAILTVSNLNGLILGENARIAQWVFERLSKKASKVYRGKYQKAKNIF